MTPTLKTTDPDRTIGFYTAIPVLPLLAALSLPCVDLAAQQTDTASVASFDLATLFELDALLEDRNGDSVPDFVNATLLLGAPANQ